MVRGILFLLLIFQWHIAFAVEVSAEVFPQEVQPEEEVVLTVNVSLEEREKVSVPQLPKNLKVKSQSQSEQVTHSFSSFSGSQKTIHKTFQYHLESPSQEGLWVVDSISVQVGKKSYKTPALKVIVSKNAKTPPKKLQRPMFPSSPFDSFFNVPSPQSPSKDSVKLKASLPSRSFYIYERVPVDWFLYNRADDAFSLNLTDRELVQPENFWTELLHAPQDLKFNEIEKIDQKKYLKALILSYAFFPLKTGKLTIDSLKIQVQTINRNSFFYFGADQFSVKSRPLVVEVLPLPQKGRGEFTGAVGSFVISSQRTQNRIQKNDLLSYKIRFEGQGLVQNIQLPDWPTSSDFKVYDILESQNFSAQKSWKEFEILLSPKRKGTLKTPEFSWTTFDPELKSYVTQQIDSQKVVVKEGKTSQTEKKSYLNTHDESSLKSQGRLNLRPLDTRMSFYQKYMKWIWGVLYALIISFIIFQIQRKKRSQRNLKKIYRKARQLCQNQKFQETGILLLNLIDQVWLEISGVGGRDVESLLRKCAPSIRHELGVQLRHLVQNLEDLSFAPKKSVEYQKNWNTQRVEEQIQLCEELIQRLTQHSQ